MGKRSPGQFERKPRDFYPTPPEAIQPLLPHLRRRARFIEPCAGDGRLIGYLQEYGHICERAFDVEPQDPCIEEMDARHYRGEVSYHDRLFITNPPWGRVVLHDLIISLSSVHPTWLLFDADWMHTSQARRYLRRCRKIVCVGRLKWEQDSAHTGKDNSAWYLFTRDDWSYPPTFFGKAMETLPLFDAATDEELLGEASDDQS